MRSQIDELGYTVIDPALEPEEVDALTRQSEVVTADADVIKYGGVRDVLRRLPSIPSRNRSQVMQSNTESGPEDLGCGRTKKYSSPRSRARHLEMDGGTLRSL